MFGKYYEDFIVGKIYKHDLSKTITESDNNLFSLLTMNHHPIHLDVEYAKKMQYGKILVVGTYVFSLVVGITVPDISGLAIANLEYERISHDAPSFIGDTISAETEVLGINESKSKSDRGIVYVETRAFNQEGTKVLTFRRRVLVPKKIFKRR
ncbi:MaoC family dehydratase [Desulfuromonas acetoxidans]|uniref:MaoC family dehydratase n=1 Tax=Desulfuromonas acetoxidans TaxID=891 RepID=UPI00293016E3|nr:MaoC family dehydratase [Desulfuromonas acetoxidans]